MGIAKYLNRFWRVESKVLFLAALLLTGSIEAPEPHFQSYSSTSEEKTQPIIQTISEKASYLGTGIALESVALLSRLGAGLCLIFPWASTVGKECLLLSHICHSAAQRVFTQAFKTSLPPSLKGIPPSQSSWHLNQMLLSQIPAPSHAEKKLLLFLEKRWLAKSTGFFHSVVDWVCPCFGVSIQVHPETTSSYARAPWFKLSQTYTNRVEVWKQLLPHPHDYPLILTRPFDLQDYLPAYILVSPHEKMSTTIKRAALKTLTGNSKIVLDLTRIFPADNRDPDIWLQAWEPYQSELSQACREHDLKLNQILCIQQLRHEEIGGIRLLPLKELPSEENDLHYQFLLEWISSFGLSANRIEMDRWSLPSSSPRLTGNIPSFSIDLQSKEMLLSDLNAFESAWKTDQPQKNLMVQSTMKLLRGFLAHLSDDTWNKVLHSPTRSSASQLSFLRIKQQLSHLIQEKNSTSFFDTASQLEQIHADLSSLLEIFAPFSRDNFPQIYQDLLTSIPSSLKPLTSYSIHTSGMTSLAGILKAVENTIGKPPHVLYGENTYFECIKTVGLVSKASLIQDATDGDWKEVDLILAQFNPILKKIDLKTIEYKVEKISRLLHQSLTARQGKPLTLALDCTIDFINSPRVHDLLSEFQDEITAGVLNIICYRSGLKFDLFGMDNYCGAPFYMIHNSNARWTSFDRLLTDPVLQADLLSLNWFCLAYQNAAPELEFYRKQIFDNTRALLNKIPPSLHHENVSYRIVPVEEGADPAFIDVKISGPLHQIRGSALVGGLLSMACMEGGHPIFYRPSFGFYHPNFTMFFSEECSTIRLTLGLDPTQVDLIAKCFEIINTLNESSP